MRWLISSSLFSDPRIILLLSLVIISIILGIILILTDKKVERKKQSIAVDSYVKSKTEEVIKEINSKDSSVERLSIINNYLKQLLKEDFNLDETKSYSSLVDYFKEKNLRKYQDICQKMFELYYSTNEVRYTDIEELKTKLIHLMEFSTRNKKIFDKKETPKKIKETLNKVSTISSLSQENLTPIMQAAEIEKQINELLKLKKYQLTKQQQTLLKELEKKQFELNKHEKNNTKLLKETQKKIKEQEKLQTTLLKKDQKVSSSKSVNPKTKEKEILSENNKTWYEDINVHPKKGKDYLKELKRKKRKLND